MGSPRRWSARAPLVRPRAVGPPGRSVHPRAVGPPGRRVHPRAVGPPGRSVHPRAVGPPAPLVRPADRSTRAPLVRPRRWSARPIGPPARFGPPAPLVRPADGSTSVPTDGRRAIPGPIGATGVPSDTGTAHPGANPGRSFARWNAGGSTVGRAAGSTGNARRPRQGRWHESPALRILGMQCWGEWYLRRSRRSAIASGLTRRVVHGCQGWNRYGSSRAWPWVVAGAG